LFSYLSVFESQIPKTQEWSTFKQFLRFLSSVLNFADANIKGFANGGTVRLQDALPDSQRVVELLYNVFGPSSSAEILATSINPEMVYRITLAEAWDDVCTNGAQNYLQFPPGVNVTDVTQHLCKAVASRSSSFQELLSLFNAREMLSQLDQLLTGHLSSSPGNETVWQLVHKAIVSLITTAEGLQGSSVDLSSAETWLAPISNWASSLQSAQGSAGLVGLCNSMVYFVNETREFQALRQFIAPTISAMKLLSDLAKLVPELDELTCIFVSDNGYDVKGAVDKIAGLGIWQDIEDVIEMIVSPSTQVDCAAPLRTYQNLTLLIEAVMTPGAGGLDMARLQSCLEKAPAYLENMLSSVTSTTSFMRQFIEIAQMPGLMDLLQNEDILPAIDFMVQAFNTNEQVLIQLDDLLTNENQTMDYLINTVGLPKSLVDSFLNASVNTDWNQTMDYLINTVGLPQYLVDSFLNASVNTDWVNFLTKPAQEVAALLCSPDQLSNIIKLPQNSPVNVTEISLQICDQDILATSGVLTNMSLPWSAVKGLLSPPEIDLATVVGDMSQQVADLITEFGDIIELLLSVLTDPNLDILRDQVPVIDDILQGKGLTRLSQTLNGLLDNLVTIIPQSPQTNIVIEDVRRILNGLLALDALTDTVMEEIQVKDFAKNPAQLRAYLTTQLGFSAEITQTIMEASFSSRVFLLTDEAANATCDEILRRILILNQTDLSEDVVQEAVCNLTDAQVKNLLDQLVPLLDVGDLVSKYVTQTTKAVLDSTNLTPTQLDDLVETIDQGFVNLKLASDIITQSPNGSDFLDAVYNARSSGFSMDALTPALCGTKPNGLFQPDFPTGGIVVNIPESAALDGISHDDKIELEELDMPNEFCVRIYESVRDSSLGNILWSYIKPIMRGKILYTPDTPATRAILKEANTTFELIDEIYRVSQLWAEGANNLKAMVDTLQDVDDLEVALQNNFVSGLIESALGISANTLLSSLDAVRSDNFNTSQIDALKTAAEFVANYTSCIETNRFQAVDSEEEMEKEAFHLSKLKNFFAGIVFMDIDDDDASTSGGRKKRATGDEMPKHITYKIRMDVDNTMNTNELKSSLWKFQAEDNFIEDMRYYRGFIHIQDMLDSAIIKLQKNQILDTPGSHIRQMPFPCHHYDNFVFLLGAYLVPVMMTFVFLASLGVATHNFVYDRENGQEATLGVMGMVSGLNFVMWLITTMVVMAAVCIVMTIMLRYTDIFIYSNPVIIFLYLLEFCFSSLMLLYMVSSFFTRTTMAILFVLMIYLISYMPYVVLVGLEVSMKFWHKILACLSSTAAFSFGTLTLSYLEESGIGVEWNNLTQDVSRDFSMHWAFIMMAIDSGVYFLIGWYVRCVKPGKYGLSQPWYFPVLPSYWCSCLKWAMPRGFKPVAEPNSGSMFEPAPPGLGVGIALQNLTKKYNSKRKAVDNLSVNFYENQITSLLGHNGAAKTTTLKMLCGVLEPTSGKVMINGNQPGCGKRSIGICPQQNALFDYMTVIQHMSFYSGIKGANPEVSTAKTETRKLLMDVDLWHARNTPVGELSYGMKRRLCVALAFVGKSRTIILDEPTSGVDPHARRNIWNLITENRLGRTILLSTHHLDEADILSDRIALLHQGKLLCCGSPAFLKRSIGHDFRLTIKKSEKALEYDNTEALSTPVREKNAAQTAAIIDFIQSMSPDAALVEQVGTDLTFNLPKDPASLRVPLEHFFRQLDDPTRQAQLGVDTYGVSDTTLEEVFLTLTMRADGQSEEEMGVVNPVMTTKDEASASADPELPRSILKPSFSRQDKLLFSPAAKIQYGPNGSGNNLSQGFENGRMWGLTNYGLQQRKRGIRHEFKIAEKCDGTDSVSTMDPSKRRRGVSLHLSQVGAMLLKRVHHYRRNWRIIISGLVLPLIFMLIALAVSTLRVDDGDMKPLLLDPSIYGPGTYSFYQDSTKNTMSTGFADTLTDPHIGYGSTCLRSWVDEYHGNGTCSAPTAWYNVTKPFQMVTCQNAWQVYTEMTFDYTVQEYRAASEDYMQNVDDQNVAAYLLRTFRDHTDNRFGGFTFEPDEEAVNSKTTEPYVWFSSKGYHALPSFFNTMSNTILRSQLYQGKNKSEYGITAINHPIKLGKAALSVKNLEADASDTGVSLIIVVALSFIPCGFILYVINERVQKERQLQNLRGISVLTYWLVAIIWDMIVYGITIGCAVGLVCIFRTDGFYLRDNLGAFTSILMLYGWAVIPMLYCLSYLFDSGSTAYLVSFCINLFMALCTVISLLVMQLFTDSQGARRAYKICKYAYLVFPQFALGQGLIDMVSNTFLYKLFDRFDVDRYQDPYSTDVLGWNLIALGCQGIFFFILTLILDGVSAPNPSLPPDSQQPHVVGSEDEDVARERERVRVGAPSDNMLVVDNLSKVYRRGWRKFLPVDHITFGVPEGECFGLLGVNGAGKTTTFRMLTGDSRPAGGSAFLAGEKLAFSDKKFGHDIGYCPQEGGLDEYLTGEETLFFHARLKGFNAEQTKAMTSDLLQRLGLVAFANVIVHKYSGGTKRKLALAVALLGEPPILYLDEPTTGMDAVTRRLAWKCIAQANRNGQSVVLTSHSMGECDALCSRIAIMVNGQIKCIGSPQHLKNKFGDGYTVVIHSVQNQVTIVTNLLLNRFPGAQIKNMHVSRVELLIPYQSAQVADIVGFLQIAEEEKTIDYYSLSQTSLDSVFINFAQEQSDNYEDQIYSSSSDKTETPSGSISSQGKLPEDADDKEAPRYVFANPQFVTDDPKPIDNSGNLYPEMEATKL
ncbi:ATP-binding cassette sub-family a member 1, partial [Plakobranchus ocellatus]